MGTAKETKMIISQLRLLSNKEEEKEQGVFGGGFRVGSKKEGRVCRGGFRVKV